MHRDAPYTKAHRRSRDDIVRDLLRHGFDLKHANVIDDFSYAEVVLEFSASADGPLFVPSGTRVRAMDMSREGQTHGVPVFEVTEDVNVVAGGTALVEAQAEYPGTPYNVDEGVLCFLEDPALGNFASVNNPLPAFGGTDHQLTRAAVYRALAIIYMDLMRMDDDAFASAFKRYQRAYVDEVQRVVAAGVVLDTLINNGLEGDDRHHGMKRFERG
ncbi:MAG: baseplate J/gp47 family protein [Phycisphaerales bacterium JB052]